MEQPTLLEFERSIFFSNNPNATEQSFQRHCEMTILYVERWIKDGHNVESNTEWLKKFKSELETYKTTFKF